MVYSILNLNGIDGCDVMGFGTFVDVAVDFGFREVEMHDFDVVGMRIRMK